MLDPIDPSSPTGKSPKSLIPKNTGKENNNDLIQLLETKIEQVEDQLNQAQISYSDLQTEYRDLQDKLTQSSDKYKRAALIMTEFLDDVLAGAPDNFLGQDLHLDVADLRHELRQSAFVVKALEGFAALFSQTERAVTASGRYHARNLGVFDEALGDVPFTKDVGCMDRKQAEAHTLDAFAKARARCFALLDQTVDPDEKLSFADFVMGAALQPT